MHQCTYTKVHESFLSARAVSCMASDAHLIVHVPLTCSLENLVVLEARENLLKSVPRSVAQLKRLQRLDLGNNEIEELVRAFLCGLCLSCGCGVSR